jgi:hypothetical protein
MNPREIKVGRTTWIRENNDPEYYNVNGRNAFERIHIDVFPKEYVEESVRRDNHYICRDLYENTNKYKLVEPIAWMMGCMEGRRHGRN